MVKDESPEFWETMFAQRQEMWGFEPSRAAVVTKDFFLENGVSDILIPGIGYGRNAQVFIDSGIAVTGIEISQSAIELARNHFGEDMTIHHGPVSAMPFDNHSYDGIFCHALIHLLDEDERQKLISDCYNQLQDNGLMVFTMISKTAVTYGQGQYLSKDRYEIHPNVKMYFYDRDSILGEFDRVGLFEIMEIEDHFPFFLVQCRKSI